MSRGRWDDWDDWGYRPPRRPADGIRAKTQRGKFGQTWWAGRWLAALEHLVDSGRLSRGRSYARSGQVTRLDVGPGGVDAWVQGSMPQPYSVLIRFRRLTDTQWDAVADAMAGEALFAARLLSGEMPEHVESAFGTAGVSLFPAVDKDMETSCSCPDWSNPCKHVAAVFYLLGERFDEDPFLMFELRGRTKEQIVEALRARRAGDPAAAPAALDSDAGLDVDSPEEAADDEARVPLLVVGSGTAGPAGAADAFWTAGPALEGFGITLRAPPVDALPVKLRGAPPDWPPGVDFIATAEPVYRAAGERARRLATGDT